MTPFYPSNNVLIKKYIHVNTNFRFSKLWRLVKHSWIINNRMDQHKMISYIKHLSFVITNKLTRDF